MSPKHVLPQLPDREMLGQVMREFMKTPSGPWRHEALRAFASFKVEDGGTFMRKRPGQEEKEYAEGLMARLESAASSVGCGMIGYWRMGIHFIPGSNLVPSINAEPFVLVDDEGRISPIIVSEREMAVQCSVIPLVFRYGIHTDIKEIFKESIMPESFF